MIISNLQLGAMIFQLIAGIAIPVLLLLFLKKKGLRIPTFLIGCGTWFVATVILEGILHSLVLRGSGIGQIILDNRLLYAIYGGAMAAIFEELARFIIFKTILKKEQGDDRIAIMYGAGHGGFECFYILVIGALNLIFYSVAINSGEMLESAAGLDADTMAQLEEAIATLSQTGPFTYILSVLERISAIISHMGLSVMVWFAAKEKVKDAALLPLALLCHFLLDFISTLIAGVLPIAVVELVVLAMALGIAYEAKRIWDKYSSPPEKAVDDGPRIGEKLLP